MRDAVAPDGKLICLWPHWEVARAVNVACGRDWTELMLWEVHDGICEQIDAELYPREGDG